MSRNRSPAAAGPGTLDDSSRAWPTPLVRAAYAATTSIASLVARVAHSGLRAAGAHQRAHDLGERLTVDAPDASPRARVWIHAASVGEVRSLAPLVAALELRGVGPLLVTTSTATGRERARRDLRLPARLGPWDSPGPLRRFLERTRPQLYCGVETELWPRRFGELERRGIPAIVVSARMTAPRVPAYRRLRGLYGPALRSLRLLAPAGERDAARFLDIGLPPDRLGPEGSLKWDATSVDDAADEASRLRRELGLSGAARWLVLGSVHPGEAGGLIDALEGALRDSGPLGLLLAPRHPRRFDDVAREVEAAGMRVHLASRGPAPEADRVVLVDRLGVLPSLYPLAFAAVVGGTFVPVGGHSPLEAAAAGCPLIAGPWTASQDDLIDPLAHAGALERVDSPAGAAEVVKLWLADDEARRLAGNAGREEVRKRRGISSVLAARIEELLR